ncbi:hypothetical protein [Pseudofrankia sp. BMG5.37]|uniref:hypothetical protein n=1 Tax=Pseudofrankia sp. BMG5.37 TaxID=3050035 RepID=UPI000A4D4E84|nr:hypothetical protein [Pseudofrankia sp. BMG5.37]
MHPTTGVAPDGQPAESDVLLCAHHLRRSAAALEACDARVYDRFGDPIDELGKVFLHDR